MHALTQQLVDGSRVLDLHGSQWTADRTINIHGDKRIRNGTIRWFSQWPLFETWSGSLSLHDLRVTAMSSKSTVVKTHAGDLDCENVYASSGCFAQLSGADSVSLVDCQLAGVPHDYGLSAFDRPVGRLTVRQTRDHAPWVQGPFQALVRLQGVAECSFSGFSALQRKDAAGHPVKDLFQIRSGGVYVLTDCRLYGRVVCGWIKDPDIPPRPLERVTVVRCHAVEIRKDSGFDNLHVIDSHIGP